MTNQPPLVSVVIPVLDEAGSLPTLYQQLNDVLAQYDDWELLFIDDGSRDESVAIIEQFIETDSHVKLIKFFKNYGKADALAAGFREAAGTFVITMDADLQDDPIEIPRLIQKLEDGWDMVSGWKKVRHDPIGKRFPSKVWNLMTRLMTGIAIHDFNCGLKAYRSEVVKSLDLYGGLHRYIPALAKQKGFSVTEIAVNHRPRVHGETKYHGSRFFHGFFDLVTVLFIGNFFSRPMHFFGFIGFFLSAIGIVINLYLTIGWFQGIWIGNRPVFFLGILLLIVGIQFISLGLLGEMLIKSTRRDEKRIQYVKSGSTTLCD